VLTPRADDFPRWYQDVLQKAQLAENGPVRGTMVIRPYGYSLWERMQAEVDQRIKACGAENAYFPLFIPQSMLQKEAEHIEGFAPECAVVTQGGGKELEEPLYVRPTSEAIICSSYAKWVSSWRDLPILINQWANVVRWEMRPRLFLRTLEFLWQEGHTAHETRDEALKEVMTMLDVYARFAEETLAIPVIRGVKSAAERFPGAVDTYCIEAMMQDGKALQAGTSHDLGQNFSKTYGIQFQARDETTQHAWGTSWGVSTRLVGALIMTHADDLGMIVPPALAPVQVVVVPIYKTEEEHAALVAECHLIYGELTKAGVRVKVDDRDNLRPGVKFFEWEKKGVPVRLALGPRDLAGRMVEMKRRTATDPKAKEMIPLDGLARFLSETVLPQIQASMFTRAKELRAQRTFTTDSYDDFKSRIDAGGFFHMRWCGSAACEAKVKEDTKATIRCIPFESAPDAGPCAICGSAATGKRAVFARSY
jgi:prolyl-tRNA synthetase